MIKAIPTQYKGINFRSRLEAKWAMMFDQLGWIWDYEPFELNGYIPDFIFDFNGKQILGEVKPLVNLTTANPPTDVIEKIERSGWNHTFKWQDEDEVIPKDYIIFGAGIGKSRYHPEVLGYCRFAARSWIGGDPSDCEVAECYECNRSFPIDINGSWDCLWCGADKSYPQRNRARFSDLIPSLTDEWNRIKNQTQWKAAA